MTAHSPTAGEGCGLSLRQSLLLRCTAEHLRARQDGGGDGQANIAAACAHCNALRHRARDPLSPLAFAAHVQHR
ncbi:HNH endonuclease [Paucibacter sp. O1-1]|uniref:HNH endonuclease n=1 Tax=Paucibacter sp. M5-1 TaxID=3015998 RepID=UPI0021D4BFEE|nr:HNH endonuclease [Paucibacter sp. M5-1]MCU7376155.1 HNH endonuclease [Paucibacter sp. O1-1]MCZ7880537.1 HNH endonuclease [Paucibacter sp. M5-1]MCZ7880582.1 HNH endonuclease [Paucibacter sp. M5-1]MDA3831167.1 HNH endonuclease [Paucibacter sp. O1-1]